MHSDPANFGIYVKFSFEKMEIRLWGLHKMNTCRYLILLQAKFAFLSIQGEIERKHRRKMS